MKVMLADEAATIDFAHRVWRALPDKLDGWTLLLRGELGAGKSTFARALIKAAGHDGAVPSPTYTLVEPYALSRLPTKKNCVTSAGTSLSTAFDWWNGQIERPVCHRPRTCR